MFVSVLILFIILFLLIKFPHFLDIKDKFIIGKYIRIEREFGLEPINFSNIIIYNSDGQIILPDSISVSTGIAKGNGSTPGAPDSNYPNDIVLIETNPGISEPPFIEFSLPRSEKISRVIIMNRDRYKYRMQNIIISIINDKRYQVFETKISQSYPIYFIEV